MKPEVKKFLKLYFGVAFGVWLVLAVMMGPGDLSCAYRDEYKDDHDRYLRIIKSEVYKRYLQRPKLNEPGMEHVPENFAEQIAFVDEYESRDEFRSELRRSTVYTVFFQCFNAFLVIWIAWRLGKEPLLRMIDRQIHAMREKIAAVHNGRDAAAERKHAAKNKIDKAPEDETRIMGEAEERVQREVGELDAAQKRRLQIMENELEDRKQEEVHAALMQIKAELVNQAIDEVLHRYQESDDSDRQAALIDGFTADVEKMHI